MQWCVEGDVTSGDSRRTWKFIALLVIFPAARDLFLVQRRFRPCPAKPIRLPNLPGDLLLSDNDYELSLLPVFADVRQGVRRKAQSKHPNEPIQLTVSYSSLQVKCLLTQ